MRSSWLRMLTIRRKSHEKLRSWFLGLRGEGKKERDDCCEVTGDASGPAEIGARRFSGKRMSISPLSIHACHPAFYCGRGRDCRQIFYPSRAASGNRFAKRSEQNLSH